MYLIFSVNKIFDFEFLSCFSEKNAHDCLIVLFKYFKELYF